MEKIHTMKLLLFMYKLFKILYQIAFKLYVLGIYET